MTRAGFQPELPPWLADVIDSCGRLFGMRASPRLLLYVCALQACAPSNAPCVHAPSAYARWQGVVLLLSMLQQIGRAECAVAMDHAGPIEVDCSTCRRHGLTSRGVFVYGGSAAVIGMGAIAVLRRDQNMLWYYGSIMLFFAFVIGLTALLTALETPVLEVAVEGVSAHDSACLEMALAMTRGARDHSALAAVSCAVNAAGATLAIRSKELFAYEEISAHHATTARSNQPL